jgi:hypothetical protein
VIQSSVSATPTSPASHASSGTWGARLGLRFPHELTAPFYSWGVGIAGTTPADAVAA